MAETPQEIVNRVLREFKRYTGDGLPGEPVNAPLPVGDPQSGTWNPRKKDLREALLAALLGAGVEAERAKEEADRALAEADRAEREADRALGYADSWESLQEAIDHAQEWAQSPDPISEEAGGDGETDQSSRTWAGRSKDDADRAQTYAAMLSVDRIKFNTVAALLADETMGYDDDDPAPAIVVGPGDIIEAQGFRYEVAAADAAEYDEETEGGVKLVLITKPLNVLPQALTPKEQQQAQKNLGVIRRPGMIKKPDGFVFSGLGISLFLANRPFTIRRQVGGEYICDFRFEYAPYGSLTMYVGNRSNGSASDDNDGLTPATAKKTIDACLANSSVRRIILEPGEHLDSWKNNPTATICTIECIDGTARLLTGDRLTYSVHSGDIYSASSGGRTVTTIVCLTEWDEFNFHLHLTRFASLAALQASSDPGWAQEGSTIYARFPGGVAPGATVTLYTGAGPIIHTGSRYLIRNVEFWGSDHAFKMGDSGFTSAPFVMLENCDLAYSQANGARVYNNRGGFVARNCRAFRNGADGFNYHDDGSRPGFAIEDHCIGVANGREGGTSNNQGSSAHERGKVIRIGGLYGSGTGPAISDINDTKTWNIGCVLRVNQGETQRQSG